MNENTLTCQRSEHFVARARERERERKKETKKKEKKKESHEYGAALAAAAREACVNCCKRFLVFYSVDVELLG